jgi:hypothetical protein
VKAFLGIVQPKLIIQGEKEPEIQKGSVSINEEKTNAKDDTFFCRYCGKENEADAIFCEKCGKKLK